MKRTIIWCVLFFAFFSTAQAQQDSARQPKTTTKSAASYRYESSFETGKTEAVKKYLVKELGASAQADVLEYRWMVARLSGEQDAPAVIKLKPGEISIIWESAANAPHSSTTIQWLEKIAAEISKLVR